MNFKKSTGTCIALQHSEENDVLEFLTSDSNNIVLGNDGDLGCYQRSQIRQDSLDIRYINTYYHKGVMYKRIYPDLFVTSKSYDLIMNSKYSFYVLKFVRFDINNIKGYKIYSVNAFTLKEYSETDIEVNYAPLKTFNDSYDYDL